MTTDGLINLFGPNQNSDLMTFFRGSDPMQFRI